MVHLGHGEILLSSILVSSINTQGPVGNVVTIRLITRPVDMLNRFGEPALVPLHAAKPVARDVIKKRVVKQANLLWVRKLSQVSRPRRYRAGKSSSDG